MAILATDPLDLPLDPETGDLDIARLTRGDLAHGVDGVAQLIDCAVQMVRGEWALDLDSGIAYYEVILGQKFRSRDVVDEFRKAILAVSGVAAVDVKATVDDARVLTVTWIATLAFGGTVNGSLTRGF